MKTPEREGYMALQLGCGAKRDKQVDKQCAPPGAAFGALAVLAQSARSAAWQRALCVR